MGCNKRAQVTVFIILGVVILSSATLFFYLSSGLSAIETGADLGLESNQDAVQLFVEKCLADTSYDALSQVLANGGYYHIDEELIIQVFWNFHILEILVKTLITLTISSMVLIVNQILKILQNKLNLLL